MGLKQRHWLRLLISVCKICISERSKKRGRGCASLTTHLSKIDSTIESVITENCTKEMKINEFLSLNYQLTEKVRELIKRDGKMPSKIGLNKMLNEITTSDEYKESGVEVDRNLEILRDKPKSV